MIDLSLSSTQVEDGLAHEIENCEPGTPGEEGCQRKQH